MISWFTYSMWDLAFKFDYNSKYERIMPLREIGISGTYIVLGNVFSA